MSSFSDVLFGEWSVKKSDSFMAYFAPKSYQIVLAYVAFIFGGQKMMKNRKPFELDFPLALWNFAFSLFSGIALYNVYDELFSIVYNDGILSSYCNGYGFYTDATIGFWGWIFCMSKAPELFDTAFLVLRKKPVIFMHWYHHAATFIYAQITYNDHPAWGRWSLVTNLFVHTVMYFYFGVRALKIKTPRIVAKFITTIQITQFLILVSIFCHLVYIKTYNTVPDCSVSWKAISTGGLMYLSYLYLFADFFYNAYIKKRASGKGKEE